MKDVAHSVMAGGDGGSEVGVVMVDDGRGSFGPLCDLRPIFGLRTGVSTNAERLAVALGAGIVGYRVPERLAAVVRESTGLPTNEMPAGERIAFVNGRLRSLANLPHLLHGPLDQLLVSDAGELIVGSLGRTAAELYLRTGELPSGVRMQVAKAEFLSAPWHLLDGLGAAITDDVAHLLAHADELGYARLPADHPGLMGSHAVIVHGSATVAPYVVFDASAGPIHIGPKAVLRPFSVLCGPCSIGSGSTVGERALIKSNTTCGPQCRLGGEIGGTSIVGYSNKTHDGHLGDSVIGEWVNLGAGTDNSNLLNTYGEVPMRLEPDGPRQRTGRIFLGAIIGDHVKCAIGTRLMTGTVIGTGAMIASSTPPSSTVHRFAWITDDGERRYALPKFTEVLRTVMKRRSLEPGPAYIAALERLHAASLAADAGAKG
jgi:UDP-N-acetylglucosamine diphosphorylase/glucosamine-1-phosphate N-acetyltransferase